jgi:hypothetical protein
MKTETDYLKSIAEEIAEKHNDDNDTLPDKHLITEANRVRTDITNHLLGIDNYTQRESFYFYSLSN